MQQCHWYFLYHAHVLFWIQLYESISPKILLAHFRNFLWNISLFAKNGCKVLQILAKLCQKENILLFSHSIFWKPTKTFFIQYCASVHIRQLIWWVITKLQFSSSFWWVIIKVQFSSFFSGLSLKRIFPALFWCFITKVHFFGIFWWVITNVQFFEFFWEGYHKSAFFRHFWWVNKKVQFSIFPLWT